MLFNFEMYFCILLHDNNLFLMVLLVTIVGTLCDLTIYILAKPLQNHDIVLVHFNNFYCMGICDKLSRHLSMLTYIYVNVDEC